MRQLPRATQERLASESALSFSSAAAFFEALEFAVRKSLSIEELQHARGRDRSWCARFYHSHNDVFAALDEDGIEPESVEVVQVLGDDD